MARIRLVHRGRRDARAAVAFEALWISSAEVLSGGYGTKKWPESESLNAGGRLYDATARMGRWNGGDGSTVHRSPVGRVTRPVSRRNDRARSVHSSYSSRIASGVGAWILFSLSSSPTQSSVLAISRASRRSSAASRSYCSSALAKRAGVVRQQLLLFQKRRVEVLADGVVPARLVLLLLEERTERVEGVTGLAADGRELFRVAGSCTSCGTSSRAYFAAARAWPIARST